MDGPSSESAITPRIAAGATPPLHELPEYQFQQLCRDLLGREPDIETCDVYGVRGQRQRGIDLLATRSDGDVDVGQCKCYKAFSVAAIKAASQEFSPHLDHWRSRRVRRFFLLVASDLERAELVEELLNQQETFKQQGIDYVWWSAATITNKLRDQPGIVRTHLHLDYWVSTICGSVPATPPTIQAEHRAVVDAALVAQSVALAARVDEALERELDEARETWRAGRRGQALDWSQRTRANEAVWTALSPATRAKVLRFQANLALADDTQLEAAKDLLHQARELMRDPEDVRTEALIALRDSGAESALRALASETDSSAINLRAALFLELDRLEQAQAELDRLGHSESQDPETLRLSALAHFGRGEMEQAVLVIRKASELRPLWQSITLVAGFLEYFAGLAPAAVPHQIPALPEPIDWMLVKRDDESMARRRSAASRFAALAALEPEDSPPRRQLQSWYLACLATDPDKREDAVVQCRALLSSDPTLEHVLAWVVARKYDVELTSSERALSALVTRGDATAMQICALVGSYCATGKPRNAVRVLNRGKSRFQTEGLEPLWILWKVQAFLANGQLPAAVRLAKGADGSAASRYALATALRVTARATGDWVPVISYAQQSYHDTGDQQFLLQLLEMGIESGNWDQATAQADEAINRIGTADVLRMAVVAAFNANRFDLCLRFLDDHRALFGASKLPNELRQVRIACQQHLGVLPDAITDAAALAREDPSVPNLLSLVSLYLAKGDTASAATAARLLRDSPELTAEDALRLGASLYLDDPGLAQTFWKGAVARGLPDDAVGAALQLAYQLGLEGATGPLHQRASQLAQEGRGGMRVGTIDDLIAAANARRTRVEQALEAYEKGDITVHDAAHALRLPLVDLYHSRLLNNERHPAGRNQFTLRVRHGGRPLPASLPAPFRRLHADITAILLANHLGCLPIVEKVYRPIYIPAELPRALIQMRSQVLPHQPSVIEALRRIEAMFDHGIEVVDLPVVGPNETSKIIGQERAAHLAAARDANGFVLEFLPLLTPEATPIPDLDGEATALLVNCRAIVESLLREGPLSREAYEQALTKLGTEGSSESCHVVPRQHAPLYSAHDTLELLATADILTTVADRFHIRVARNDAEAVRQAVHWAEEREEVAAWVTALMGRINSGIDDGRYQLMPELKPSDASGAATDNVDLLCLQSLIQYEAEIGDAIWVDDRRVNSFSTRPNAAVVGINEVLGSLLAAGSLSQTSYFGHIYSLRAANLRFIPFDKDEILYQLAQASVQDGQVVETTELATIRRSLAACLLDGTLQPPPREPGASNPQGELLFIARLVRAITGALAESWLMADDVIAGAWAEWIWARLYLDQLDLIAVSGLRGPQHEARFMAAASLRSLLAEGLLLRDRTTGEVNASARKRYLSWLDGRVLKLRTLTDHDVVTSAATMLKASIGEVADDVAKGTEKLPDHVPVWAIKQYLGRLVDELPESIRNELVQDGEFAVRVGRTFVMAAMIGDLAFDPDLLWDAVGEALNGRTGAAIPLGQNQPVVFQALIEALPGVTFRHPRNGQTVRLAGEEFHILSDSVQAREEFLREHRDWFDCAESAFQESVAEIASTESRRARLDMTVRWRNASAALYYRQMLNGLTQDMPARPPDAQTLLRHYRLSPNEGPSNFIDAWDDAAQRLLEDEGLLEAIKRSSTVPSRLPNVLVQAARGLTLASKRQLVRELLAASASPLMRLHATHLLVSIEDPSGQRQPFRRLARRLLSHILSAEGLSEVDALVAILGWTDSVFEYWADLDAWPASTRLAMVWAHANHVYSAVEKAASSTEISEQFAPERRVSAELFSKSRHYRIDISHPRRLSSIAFLLGGANYAIGNDTELMGQRNRDALQARIDPSSEIGQAELMALLLDPGRLPNALGSFLAGDRADMASKLGFQGADAIRSDKLRKMLNTAVAALHEDRDSETTISAWRTLLATLGDAAPPDDVREELTAALLTAKLSLLVEVNPIGAQIAVWAASLQAINLADADVRSHLIEELVRICNQQGHEMATAKAAEQLEPNGLGEVIVEAAIHLAVASERPQREIVTEFASIALQLINAGGWLVPILFPLVQQLYERLGIDEAHELALLLTKLRAELD